MKEKRTRRWLSLLLTVVMVLSLFPTTVAYAAETEDEAPADNAGVEIVDVSEGIPADLDDTAKEMLEDLTSEEPGEVSGVDEAADEPAAEPAEEPAAEEPAAEPVEEPAAEEPAAVSLDPDTFYRIFHLDCGRKYFSVDQIEALIDTLAANDYTHLELAFGNDGLRFLLNDMSVTANDTTYSSSDVKAGIQAGNKAYYDDPNGNELTQSEMDSIISYADKKGIGIIPLLNTPGHMDAILHACKALCDSKAAYESSSTTIDVTNGKAVAFTQALVQKYVDYFANNGCELFNLGADEYAGTSFGNLQSTEGSYEKYADYVNSIAAIIKKAGMVPLAFNDGIYYNGSNYSGNSSIKFDTDIVICYWTSGYNGYYPASVEYLQSRGFKNFIHTDESWYYVLGRNDSSWAGYNTAENATRTIAVDSMSVKEAGAMICLWCDTPSASYTSNQSKVTTLISNLANSNPTYFVASKEPGESEEPETPETPETEYRTITVSVGGTATDTIDGYNYAGSYETENPNIATVEVTGDNGIPATTTYNEEKSVSCKTLIRDDSEDWVAASKYYYKADDGSYYPVYAKRSSDGFLFWSTYTYTWGYSTTNSSNNVTQIGDSQETDSTSDPPNITVYTKSGTDGTPASTTVTFTGVAVGETEVTIGHVHYTIKVIAEDLSTVTPLTVEYWITNLPVTADGATSKDISAESAYGEAGVDVSTLVPETGTYAYGSVVFWKGTVLDSSNHQTTDGGDDETADGKDFNLIRYYNGKWQYFYNNTWNTVNSTDQVVIYWLQPTEVTKEITTLVKDWGFDPSAQGDNENKVALTVAVVYPDGTVSPAEGDMYATSTTLFNYWKDRDIGIVAPVNNSDYVISKITVTDGTRDQRGTGKWGANDTITWEKVTNEAGKQWYNETTYWQESDGGTPMVNGALSNITWSTYNTAKLVLIYLKPVHYDTNLTVKWVDDSNGGSLISTMEVAVSSDGTPTTFYNGLKQNSALPTEGVGGTFTLDDTAYVTNSSNVNQTFNKNISTVPGVAAQYKSGLYAYDSADLSADGMTLTLHYKLKDNLEHQYVLDFGLPVQIPVGDLVKNPGDVTDATGANIKFTTVDSVNYIVYTPPKVMTGTVTVPVTLFFGDNSQKVYIGIIPASNVLYEDGFLSVNTEKGVDGYVEWKSTTTTAAESRNTQDSVQTSLYGYDEAYAASTLNGFGSARTVTLGSTENKASQYLRTTFYGTGFDLIGTAGYNTGYVYLSIKGNGVNKLIIIDTSYGKEEANDTLYQVPLAHVQDLQQGTYEVNIRAAYRAANETHPEGTTVTIDGFRVYRSTTDTAYTAAGEQGAKYHNILNAIQYGQNGYNAAFVEGKDNYTFVSRTDYEAAGGPQNEVYLGKGQAVVLDTNLIKGNKVQVSARAVTGTPAKLNNTQPISSNTEMYYEVKAGDGGVVVLSNTGDGLLALGNLKVLNTAQASASSFALEEVTEDTLQTASRMMVSYSAAPEAGTFTPEKLDVKVKSSGAAHGNRRVTVTVTASADVAKLTINGETLNPVKVRKGKRGDIGECTYVFTDTFKRGETKSYDIIAYNADGAASETTTVTG